MKVRELIEMLSVMPLEANVFIGPFEGDGLMEPSAPRIAGVASNSGDVLWPFEEVVEGMSRSAEQTAVLLMAVESLPV